MTVAQLDFAVIKEQASFLLILQRYGIKHNGSRGQLMVCCPFHSDKRPSLSVNMEQKLYHCFSCGEEGDVFHFVAALEKVSIGEAARIVAGACGIPLNGEKPLAPGPPKHLERHPEDRESQTSRAASPPVRAVESGAEADQKPLGFTLKLNQGHPYLFWRGLTPELIEEFGLGYSKSRVYMPGRVCIPIHCQEGELVAYAGRWACDEVPPGVPKYLLPRGFKKSDVLFNLHRVASADHVVLVEGYWSVFRLYALGIPAVALMGRTLSRAQEELLACSGARFLTLLLDGDEPGRKAAQALLPRLTRNWFVYQALLPDGQQPDTVDEEELRRVLWALL